MNEKVEIEQKHLFLSKLFEIEAKFENIQFDTQMDCETYINENIPPRYRQYYEWNQKTKKIVRSIEKVNSYLSRVGYFIMETNKKKLDKLFVLSCYRNKDVIEKMFDVFKNEEDGKRLRVHSKYTADGKLFVKFIALIIYMKISQVMKNHNLFEKYTLKEMLFELRKIRFNYVDNFEPFVSEISKRQKEIFQAFGIKK